MEVVISVRKPATIVDSQGIFRFTALRAASREISNATDAGDRVILLEIVKAAKKNATIVIKLVIRNAIAWNLQSIPIMIRGATGVMKAAISPKIVPTLLFKLVTSVKSLVIKPDNVLREMLSNVTNVMGKGILLENARQLLVTRGCFLYHKGCLMRFVGFWAVPL